MRAIVRYLKSQWQLNKIDEAYLDNLVALNKITGEEKLLITGE